MELDAAFEAGLKANFSRGQEGEAMDDSGCPDGHHCGIDVDVGPEEPRERGFEEVDRHEDPLVVEGGGRLREHRGLISGAPGDLL